MKNIVEDMGLNNFYQAYRLAAFQRDGKILEISGISVRNGDNIINLAGQDAILAFERGSPQNNMYTLECGTEVLFLPDELSRVSALQAVRELQHAHPENRPCDDDEDEDYDEDAYNEWYAEDEYYTYYSNFLSQPDLCIRPPLGENDGAGTLEGIRARNIETLEFEVIPLDFFDSLAVFGQYGEKMINSQTGGFTDESTTIKRYSVMHVRPETRCLRTSQYSKDNLVEYFRGNNYFTLEEAVKYFRDVVKIIENVPTTAREIALNKNCSMMLHGRNKLVVASTKLSKVVATIDMYTMKVTSSIPDLKKFMQLEGII